MRELRVVRWNSLASNTRDQAPDAPDTAGSRMVRASEMPRLEDGSVYAPVMTTIEEAADLVLGSTSLPPSTAKSHRYPQER